MSTKTSKPEMKVTSTETKVKAKEEIKLTTGVVLAKLLNVREKPEPTAKVLKVINENDKVQVYLNSEKLWYEIITADGVHGYCMKEFISVNKS